jgi:hypothetical protein
MLTALRYWCLGSLVCIAGCWQQTAVGADGAGPGELGVSVGNDGGFGPGDRRQDSGTTQQASTAPPSIPRADAGTLAQDDAETRAPNDAGPPPEVLGFPGAHVWLATSVAIELRNDWSFLGWGGSPSSAGSSCLALDRTAMSQSQLEALAGLTLIPLQDQCSADGHSYFELTVYEADGSSNRYRDTGCPYLRIPDATAMLPHVLLNDSDFPLREAGCQVTTDE